MISGLFVFAGRVRLLDILWLVVATWVLVALGAGCCLIVCGCLRFCGVWICWVFCLCFDYVGGLVDTFIWMYDCVGFGVYAWVVAWCLAWV